MFQRGKIVLEKKVLQCHPDIELTNAEEEAVKRLISVFQNNLPEKLKDVGRKEEANEFKTNVTIAHNFLGPLGGECVLSDLHKVALFNFKKTCPKPSCQDCKTINTASACGMEGLCMGK